MLCNAMLYPLWYVTLNVSVCVLQKQFVTYLLETWIGISNLFNDGPLHCVTVELPIVDKASFISIG